MLKISYYLNAFQVLHERLGTSLCNGEVGIHFLRSSVLTEEESSFTLLNSTPLPTVPFRTIAKNVIITK